MIGLPTILAFAMAAPVSVEYDCQADKQIVLMSKGTKWNYNSGDVDTANREVFSWKFVTQKSENAPLTVSHNPGILDAVGVGGTYETIQIAPGQFAFATKKDRNCLFTELACGALVEISDINKSKAIFSLVPVGSVEQEDGSRDILQMVMLGSCKRTEIAK